MTVERAAEIVQASRPPVSYDLFEHFVNYFGFSTPEKMEWFARLCGYAVAHDIRLADQDEE